MEINRALIVFAKAPREGQVKTRLAANLGTIGALDVYRRMAEGLWSDWRSAQKRGVFHLWLSFDPPEAEPEVRAWLEGADRYLPQVPGNLGQRLGDALASAFRAGYKEVAVVGTDAPAVTSARVTEGFSKLEEGWVVLGPTLDGGFYLMALRQPLPDLGALLEGVPWSSSETLASLIQGVTASGLDVHLLQEARDIDTVEDLRAHQRSSEMARFPL